jgi:hypothetical protein
VFGKSSPLEDGGEEETGGGEEGGTGGGGTDVSPPKGKHPDIWALVVAATALSSLILLGLLWGRDPLKIDDIPDAAHTGSRIVPTPSVWYNGTLLTAGEDFTYSYGENKDVGTGTVTITLGDNGRKATVTFKIVA